MKFSCTQENFNQGLFVVSHVASKNSTLPILNNILIQAKDGVIKLSTTNLEIGVTCLVRGKVEEEGEVTINAKLLTDYISILPKDRVDVVVEKNTSEVVGEGGVHEDATITIICKNHATKIKGQLATDYPLIPKIEKGDQYLVDPLAITEGLKQVLFSVSISETRPEINGVLFNFDKNQLVLAATDSYRLAERSVMVLEGSSTNVVQCIVPSRTLQELQRILGNFKDPADIAEINQVKIVIGENQALFSFGSVELTTRLIDGHYPPYQEIIPQASNTKAIADVSELVKAIKAASLFARSGIYDVTLMFNPDEQEISISSMNQQLGENTSRVAREITGQPGKIVLNYRYLLDGLQNIGTDEVVITVIDADSPCVIRPTGEMEKKYTYIIMPIRQ